VVLVWVPAPATARRSPPLCAVSPDRARLAVKDARSAPLAAERSEVLDGESRSGRRAGTGKQVRQAGPASGQSSSGATVTGSHSFSETTVTPGPEYQGSAATIVVGLGTGLDAGEQQGAALVGVRTGQRACLS